MFCASSAETDLESRDHLFFECSFSSRIWKAGLVRCQVKDPPSVWADVLRIGCNLWKKKALSDTLCRLVLSSTVYNLWRAHNEIKHHGHRKTEEQILKHVIWKVRTRILGRESSEELGRILSSVRPGISLLIS
jgi:hypothetical protein